MTMAPGGGAGGGGGGGADTEMTTFFRPVRLHLDRRVGRTGLFSCLEGTRKIA